MPPSPEAVDALCVPRELSRIRDVQFFNVGNLGGKTFVIYMIRDNVGESRIIEINVDLPGTTFQRDSVFQVLEPVRRTRSGLPSQWPEWFRVYRVGFTQPSPPASSALKIF